MRSLLTLSALAAGLAWGGGMAQAAECGDVTIANMNWQSAEVLANVDKFIMAKGYGCNASLVAGDTVPSITSMVEKGQPDVAPETWINLLPDLIKQGLADKKIVASGPALSDGGVEGIWIPRYIADAHPDIKSFDDALKHPELFPSPEDPSKGAVFNGPQGWGSVIVVSHLFQAHKAESKSFVLVDPGSAAGLDASIVKASERHKGWLGQYWSPTSIVGKYDLVRLDLGPNDMAEWTRCTAVADCKDPKPNDWPVDVVQTMVTTKFAERAGPAFDYLKARSWSNDTVNKLLAWMTDNQATGEDGAKHFLKTDEDVWTKWVSPDVAKKVKAAL